MPGLLERRLIFVTGKGGVGKSTVAIALGLVAARRGLRTIVAELASQERVRQTFAQSGETFEEVELADGLFTISIDPESAMEEYLRVKTGPVGQALGLRRVEAESVAKAIGRREDREAYVQMRKEQAGLDDVAFYPLTLPFTTGPCKI